MTKRVEVELDVTAKLIHRVFAACCFAIGCFIVLCVSQVGCRAEDAKSQSKVVMPERGLCAHRGAADTHPENTLPAFQEAIRLGAQMIEFDVRMTKDGRLVILHDATVDRTTNGAGRVSELTFKAVRGFDAGSWKHARFKGEQVPTLSESLRMMPENIWLNVHLKEGAKLGEAVTREIVKQKRLHQAFLACEREAAEAARKVAPAVLICNMDDQRGGRTYVDATIEMKGAFLQFFRGKVERKWVVELNQRGIRSNYCCTDDAALIGRLFDAGVGFVLVDQLDASMKVARDSGIMPLKPVYRRDREKKR